MLFLRLVVQPTRSPRLSETLEKVIAVWIGSTCLHAGHFTRFHSRGVVKCLDWRHFDRVIHHAEVSVD